MSTEKMNASTLVMTTAILRLQVNFRGVIDFTQERFSFDASLFDSKLLSFTLTGDMAMRLYFSHDTPEGTTFDDRERAAGYPRPGAENIAQGYRSADAVMQGWQQSDGHRRNILACTFTTMGVGLDTRGWFWTQDFGR